MARMIFELHKQKNLWSSLPAMPGGR